MSKRAALLLLVGLAMPGVALAQGRGLGAGPGGAAARRKGHYDHFTEPDGTTWLVVTTLLADPAYLTGQYVTTNQFKKIPDRQGWDPTPCRADQPR